MQGQADERMMQLLRLFNNLLDRHVESRRRLLQWHTPIMVTVWPGVSAQGVGPACVVEVERGGIAIACCILGDVSCVVVPSTLRRLASCRGACRSLSASCNISSSD
jgi:hypothetical protein